MLWKGFGLRKQDILKIVDELLNTDMKEDANFCIRDSLLLKLCKAAKKQIEKEPNLLSLPSIKFVIVGDLHGQFQDLRRIFRIHGFPPHTSYIFLGDMVDRGKYGLEIVSLLMALKLLHPNSIYLLRGNHECAELTYSFGFRTECLERTSGGDVWGPMIDLFDALPLAAHIQAPSNVFCVHGGISPYLKTLDQVNSDVSRPTDPSRDSSPVLTDLLWADPCPTIEMWGCNSRGMSCVFGMRAVKLFLETNGLKRIVRGHTATEKGYDVMGQEDEVITIFSCSNYKNWGNDGAVMLLAADGTYTIDLLPTSQTSPRP